MRKKLLDHFKANKFPEDGIKAMLADFDSYMNEGMDENDSLARLTKKWFPKKDDAKTSTGSIDYRKKLFNALASSTELSQSQLNDVFAQFDRYSAIKGQRDAFLIIGNVFFPEKKSYESTAGTLNVLGKSPPSIEIATELAKINKENFVDTNRGNRLRKAVDHTNGYYSRIMAGLNATLNSSFTGGKHLLLFNHEDCETILSHLPKMQSKKDKPV